MRKYILFDLDGTLTDPAEGITNSVAYALRRYGIEVEDRRTLECFIGPPLADSFCRHYGFTPAKGREAVGVFREYFSARGIYENEVFPGVPEMLAALREAGATLAVASSKPTVFVEKILVYFDLRKHFAAVMGSELDGRRERKAEVVAETLRVLSAAPGDAVMVGDRMHDIAGGHENGLPAVGVLYGYGGREELTAAGADALAATPEELLAALRLF